MTRGPVLSIRELTIERLEADGMVRPLVTNVSFDVEPGEVLGVVGESGSGKSITALAVLGLLPRGVFVSSGSITLDGHDVLAASESDLRALRGARAGMIFQDPLGSLDPSFTIGDQIVEAILAHEKVTVAAARGRALEMLTAVRINDPARCMRSWPHELSGGMRQRVMIAIALALRPRLLIADEPTTALDVTTQAAIVELVRELRTEFDMSVLWISHDLGVVAGIADRVAVLYAGDLVETGEVGELFSAPQHPYTAGLLESSRFAEPGEPFATIPGSVPEPKDWPTGCRFASRCARATAECETPVSLTIAPAGDRAWRCVHPMVKEAAL